MRASRAGWLVSGMAVAMVVVAGPAGACGGLVAPNGAVRLANTTTLAAWHAGLERYVTSFEFQGGATGFGDIVPLPAVPAKIEKAGAWTLQRLLRELPPAPQVAGAGAGATEAGPAVVIQQVHIDALELTVLKGGGSAVTDWVQQHGFAVSTDLPAMLDWYAKTSPVFLAVRFDPVHAKARGQIAGDGTPIQITMAVPQPWVPLRILTLAKSPAEFVTADVFLLTDSEPLIYGPIQGAKVDLSKPASPRLLDDLRSDRASMSWIPSSMWLTHLAIAGEAQTLDNDLVVEGAGRAPAQRVIPAPTTTTTTIVPLPSGPVRLLSGPRPTARQNDRGPRVAAALLVVLVGGACVGVVRRSRGQAR